MGQGIQIGGAGCVTNPKTFLAGSLKTGVVAFTFGAQSISALEAGGLPVNGKPVGIRDRFVFGTTSVFLAVVPIFVVTGTAGGLGFAERATEFLAQAANAVGSLTIFVHSKAGIADRITGRNLVWVFCTALV